MARSKTGFTALICLAAVVFTLLQTDITVQARNNSLDDFTGGVAAILEPGTNDTAEIISATAKELNLTFEEQEPEEESKLVMANVKYFLNVRCEAKEDADAVGQLYKDCGGTILERKDGWTKLQSGNIIGWAKDEYLLFDEDAKELANEVGKLIATVNTETIRVRMEPNADADVYALMPKGSILDVVDEVEEGSDWIRVDYEGNDGYVSAEYIALDFQIDAGETMSEIEARQKAEEEAKRKREEAARNVNYSEYTADADTTMLLAALVQCEAGGESYEGQVAVAAVVMNRVRSGAYPNSIHGVIYASGQFTPAMNGKVNQVYESGKISQSCINAANEALGGTSNIGDKTHFRRNDGRDGIVIGNHVFY
ncbi:MAG: cell wall hydrolase [Lachnospiraceae bacterium]|nr:cell wall hydrolase [Lachnospiraceae bacterium]